MIDRLTDLEIREAFHCLLVANIPESYRAPATGIAPLRLKGGVNLRFFHESARYSEDIDFDLIPARGPSFQSQLVKVLNSPAFRKALLAVGITEVELSDLDGGDRGFKQKMRIMSGGVLFPTKIEVSYREETPAGEALVLEIPALLRERYGLRQPVQLAAYPGAVSRVSTLSCSSSRRLLSCRRSCGARPLKHGQTFSGRFGNGSRVC